MKHKILFLLILLSILPLLGLIPTGLPQTHDGPDHVARIANFYASLSEGSLIPRWASNLNWGYGHPILMFLYPLPSYIASLFLALGAPLVASVKLVFAVSFVASTLAMYLWARESWGRSAGFIAALLYGFAPYRFVDLYVRGAIGEHVAFVFPPLVLYGLLRLVRGSDVYRWGGITAICMGLFIIAHNAVAIMFLPLIILYALYLYLYETKRDWRFLWISGVSILGGFVLAAFFWIPAFFEGKYTLRDIVTADDYRMRFVPFMQLVHTPWNYGGTDTLPKQFGVFHWGAIIAGTVALRLSREENTRIFAAGLIVITIVATMLMLGISRPIWDMITLLQKFQFPWRFLSVIVFATAALGGLASARVSLEKRRVLFILLAVGIVGSTVHMWRPVGYLVHEAAYYTDVFAGTTDTGESSPVWSVRFMEEFPGNAIDVIDGDATIHQVDRSTTVRSYVIASHDGVRVRENTLYFPGWEIYVDGVPVTPEFQDPAHRGLMTFHVPAGEHTVDVEFGETKLRWYANIVSIGGIVFVVFVTVMPHMIKRKRV